MKRYSGFKLLAVDDNDNNLFTLRSLIKKHMDVEILEATSGTQALEIGMGCSDIDLIILDVQMPEMDGFETASMFKKRKLTRDIPIIFLTAAFKADEFQRKGFELGAVDYLLKPIDDNLLLNKISAYFRLIEKERQLNVKLEEQVKERTRELAESKYYLQQIISSMGEALLVLDASGGIKSANPAACKLLDYEETRLTGLSISDVFVEDAPEQANAFFGTWLEALIRAGVLKAIDARFVRSDGKNVSILFSRTAIKNTDGEITDIICIAKDMTGFIREGNTDD